MKKILFAIAAVMLSISLSAQNMGGAPMGGPGNGMPPGGGGGPRGERPMGKPGDKDGKKPKAPKKKKTVEAYIIVPQMYAYAVGITAGDSVVYVSDVLILKNARLSKVNKFLVDRQDYSAQFKDYLVKNLDEKYRTCAVIFNENYRKISRDYVKLQKKYAKKKLLVKIIDQTKFRFIIPGGEE